MRKLEPGTRIRVEHNAQVVSQVEDNPYWYEVEYPDGRRETVSIARINWLADKARAAIDTDCSIQVVSSRLSAAGALDLLLWLKTHEHELQAAVHPEPPAGHSPDDGT